MITIQPFSTSFSCASQLLGDVDELETLSGRIKDAYTIGFPGREDNLAISSRSCPTELICASQLLGDVDELDTPSGRIKDAYTIGIPGCEDNLAIGSRSCSPM